jgi:outer membrane PBP1 activator LpoA protein
VIVTLRASASGRARHARCMADREYRLTVKGELGDRAGSAFEGMTLSHEKGNTVLVGRVRDQAQLQGVLQRVSDLGLTLLGANAIDEDVEGRRGD